MRTLFLSHRGESDDAPENTLNAFQLAMDQNSDGIELDIRLTADKKVVCCHDETLERVAGSNLKVCSSTYADLQKIHPVPLLSEALAVLKKDAVMQIEIKGSPEAAFECRDLILNYPYQDKLTISSFEQESILCAAELFPDLKRVLLIDLEAEFGHFPSAEQVIPMLEKLKCGISFKATFNADVTFVETLKKAGFPVICWGVSSDELGLAMADRQVDAMTCNHAVKLRKMFLDKIK